MELILQKWNEIIESIKIEHEVSNIAFTTWLVPLKPYKLEGNTLLILTPKELAISYIERKYSLAIMVAVAEFTGMEYQISFISNEDVDKKDLSPKEEPKQLSSISVATAAEKANLNPRYTFDTFIVGSNNRFAHSAALAVAEEPGQLYNPLFLYGGAGLGKTHLMHSIAHYILEKNPEARVLYTTSEAFTNELIESIRNGNSSSMSKFRDKYRNIDVLLIDDIQFIIGKESTQEEFFHTFNHLHSLRKHIIISSDKPPKDIETLEERLRSRFEMGLTADISLPDYETRMAILRKKVELDNFDIDDKVIEYIATNIKSNIRELEGALNKLIALYKLEKKPITVELAESELKDIISPDTPREVTLQLILDVVADHFHVSPDDIISSKRQSEIVMPRQIVMYLCRDTGKFSLKNIGKFLGGRDHTTIIHGADKIEAEIQKSESLSSTIDTIKKKINPH
ncbi:MAG: chromosomal replication initiator protein DnaA [Lachnospiraceae bacterium]|nr:chromosomal replication initiator protein DnaA [Lachnospiraceae bacterium]